MSLDSILLDLRFVTLLRNRLGSDHLANLSIEELIANYKGNFTTNDAVNGNNTNTSNIDNDAGKSSTKSQGSEDSSQSFLSS
ncbi:uncharacterized protein ASCRUDRAFT_74447, partial [Ascoidea rubescens DSM 1968]